MRTYKKWIAVSLCLCLLIAVTGCRQGEPSGGQAQTEAAAGTASQSAAQKETDKKTAEKKAKEKKEKEQSAESSKKETEQKKTVKKTAASGKEKTAGRQKSTGKEKTAAKAAAKETEVKKPAGHVLTIKSKGKEVYFTQKQLMNMGASSYKYSFRNKDSEHRQFLSTTGVKFSKILSKSGFSGSTACFHSKDGYTRDFSISELSSSKKAFLKKNGTGARAVPAVISVKGSEAYRLCFGQSADDSDENGDYNAQYWVKWIDTIEIY